MEAAKRHLANCGICDARFEITVAQALFRMSRAKHGKIFCGTDCAGIHNSRLQAARVAAGLKAPGR